MASGHNDIGPFIMEDDVVRGDDIPVVIADEVSVSIVMQVAEGNLMMAAACFGNLINVIQQFCTAGFESIGQIDLFPECFSFMDR